MSGKTGGIYFFTKTTHLKIANPGNGFNGVTPNVGSDDAKDSDVSIYGFSDVLTLGAGQTTTIDGGLTTGSQC